MRNDRRGGVKKSEDVTEREKGRKRTMESHGEKGRNAKRTKKDGT